MSESSHVRARPAQSARRVSVFMAPTEYRCGIDRRRRSGAGVELERRPVKRIMVQAAVKQRELGRAQGGVRAGSFIEFVIEAVHQSFSGRIADLPEAGNHVVGSSSQESPGKSYQSLAGVGALTSA